MGAERRTMMKSDLENFPFPIIDAFSKQQRKRAVNLSSQLETASEKPWKAINDFIFDLYGLDEYDCQVVRDTLEIAAPFKKSRVRANTSPKKTERNEFYDELKRLLAPSFDVTQETVLIDEVEVTNLGFPSSWYFFAVCSASTPENQRQATPKGLISQITREANKTGCSRVIVHGKGRLLVGIIGQYRYWTLSRARLCALNILRNNLDVFPIGRS
jgi:hypothetical protein